jgi:hypothetical protein
VRVWLVGVQPFVYVKTACRVLALPVTGRRIQAMRFAILGVALTLFGVTAVHHLLRKAGFADDEALRLAFVGPFLNVPYRVLLSSLAVGAAVQLGGPIFG